MSGNVGKVKVKTDRRVVRTRDTLGDALVELMRDAALRERLAEQVRAMNFGDESWLSIAKKTLAVYEGVVEPQR